MEKFNPQKHFDGLMDIQSIILNASMLSEGLHIAGSEMEEKQFSNAATGAFYLISMALEKVNVIIEEMETPFKVHHNTKWQVEILHEKETTVNVQKAINSGLIGVRLEVTA